MAVGYGVGDGDGVTASEMSSTSVTTLLPKLVKALPRAFTPAYAASEMNDARSAYSMRSCPSALNRNRLSSLVMTPVMQAGNHHNASLSLIQGICNLLMGLALKHDDLLARSHTVLT